MRLGIEILSIKFIHLIKNKMAATKLYDVKYYNKNGRLLETIAYQIPTALAKWMKRTKQNTSHKMGVIKLELNGK